MGVRVDRVDIGVDEYGAGDSGASGCRVFDNDGGFMVVLMILVMMI